MSSVTFLEVFVLRKSNPLIPAERLDLFSRYPRNYQTSTNNKNVTILSTASHIPAALSGIAMIVISDLQA